MKASFYKLSTSFVILHYNMKHMRINILYHEMHGFPSYMIVKLNTINCVYTLLHCFICYYYFMALI